MHIWSMKLLAAELRDNKLTEVQAFRYLFVLALLGAISWGLAWTFGMGTSLSTIPFGFVFPILSVGLIVIGLMLCFKSFQHRKGHDFIPKFICLLLPANVRLFVVWIVLSFSVGMVVRVFPSELYQNALVIANATIVTILMGMQFVLVHHYLLDADRTGQVDTRPAA